MNNIYFIGGSPCSGKSTVAEKLAEKYDLFYFKVDDGLDKYIAQAAMNEVQICKKVKEMSPDEIWMRDPKLQCMEEFQIYEEIFYFVMADIKRISCSSNIITEGAAYYPDLMKKAGITYNQYFCIVPSADFQISHYKQRDWVHFILEGCSDKEQAFDNWMQRDVLYAKRVETECQRYGYESIVNDGQYSIEELVQIVTEHFGLAR